MLPGGVLDKFVERRPAAVMVRATVERLLRPERLDEIFEAHRSRQYEREIVCSELVALMVGVATRTHQSVHASYLAAQKTLGVSAAAVYGKLACFEPRVTAALVRDTAIDMAEVIAAMPRGRRKVLPGREVFYLDGNHLAATEHRLQVLRTTRAGPLPGQTLALLDAQTELVVELVPCECGHAQERSLLPELLERIRADTVLVADRNFCTVVPLCEKFLFGLFRRGALFVIRQHASTLTYRFEGRRRKMGRCETGLLYEQTLVLTDVNAAEGEVSELKVRRITLVLDTPHSGRRRRDPPADQPAGQSQCEARRRNLPPALDHRPHVINKVGLSNIDRCPALRGRNAGRSQGGPVLVRDGRPRVERLRGGPSRPPLDTRRTEDRRRTVGRTLPS